MHSAGQRRREQWFDAIDKIEKGITILALLSQEARQLPRKSPNQGLVVPDEVKTHILSWKAEIDKLVKDIDAWESSSLMAQGS